MTTTITAPTGCTCYPRPGMGAPCPACCDAINALYEPSAAERDRLEAMSRREERRTGRILRRAARRGAL